jgi:activator of 2-hydroxyglutaryl-CoA dehydratase
VVFAELNVLGLLNQDVSPQKIGGAAVKAVAVRVNSVINDITIPARDCVVLVGGVAKNKAFVKALQDLSGLAFIVPDHAEFAGAIGAALYAAA